MRSIGEVPPHEKTGHPNWPAISSKCCSDERVLPGLCLFSRFARYRGAIPFRHQYTWRSILYSMRHLTGSQCRSYRSFRVHHLISFRRFGFVYVNSCFVFDQFVLVFVVVLFQYCCLNCDHFVLVFVVLLSTYIPALSLTTLSLFLWSYLNTVASSLTTLSLCLWFYLQLVYLHFVFVVLSTYTFTVFGGWCFLVVFLKDRQIHARSCNTVTACLGVYVPSLSLRYTCAIAST